MWREFGQWLAQLRRRAGLSKRAAAKLVGVSEATWRTYEAGGSNRYGTWVLPGPRDETLHRIAHAFEVPIEEVYARTDKEPPPELPSLASEDATEYERVPAALAGVWRELDPAERQRLLGYAEALREQRRESQQ
jgi:transcriptional regulator with XRE-family HTH domain